MIFNIFSKRDILIALTLDPDPDSYLMNRDPHPWLIPYLFPRKEWEERRQYFSICTGPHCRGDNI
jgi:hypothetical protein